MFALLRFFGLLGLPIILLFSIGGMVWAAVVGFVVGKLWSRSRGTDTSTGASPSPTNIRVGTCG